VTDLYVPENSDVSHSKIKVVLYSKRLDKLTASSLQSSYLAKIIVVIMTYNVDNLLEIVSYFANKADKLEVEALGSKFFDNPGDRGNDREDILRGFLGDHLPKRCEVIKGGYVFNEFGNRSKQIDLIVTNDNTIRFDQTHGKHTGKSFNTVEGTLAAISVKSTLDKREFEDAIENLASIPTSRSFAPINKEYFDVIKEMLYKIPYKVIFAFKGQNVDATVKHLEEYIHDKKPDDRVMPDVIIVNKSYYIYKISLDGEGAPGGKGKLRQGSYRAVAHAEHIGGIALMRLVSEIQMVSNFSSLAIEHFNMYELTIQEFLKQRRQAPLVRDINRDALIGTDESGTQVQ
jgi:hypothetical protein